MYSLSANRTEAHMVLRVAVGWCIHALPSCYLVGLAIVYKWKGRVVIVRVYMKPGLACDEICHTFAFMDIYSTWKGVCWACSGGLLQYRYHFMWTLLSWGLWICHDPDSNCIITTRYVGRVHWFNLHIVSFLQEIWLKDYAAITSITTRTFWLDILAQSLFWKKWRVSLNIWKVLTPIWNMVREVVFFQIKCRNSSCDVFYTSKNLKGELCRNTFGRSINFCYWNVLLLVVIPFRPFNWLWMMKIQQVNQNVVLLVKKSPHP